MHSFDGFFHVSCMVLAVKCFVSFLTRDNFTTASVSVTLWLGCEAGLVTSYIVVALLGRTQGEAIMSDFSHSPHLL